MNYSLKVIPRNLPVFTWLLILTIMTFLMVLIGGLTRLTDSGLSMVNWEPIMGSIPPLSKKSWEEVFNAYKNSPEFLIVNKSMTLNEFRYIFWWEWGHRFFARCIGLVLVLPFIYFLFKKKLSKKFNINIFILFSLGVFQAIVGWWMVKSGLTENPYVSPYRLAFHLTNAVIILSILCWLTFNAWSGLQINFLPNNISENMIFFLIFLLFITIVSGAFMAGTNAGQSFNTYPMMNDKFFPENYFLEDSGFRNIFENTIAINFNHRWLATITFLAIILMAFYIKFSKKFKRNTMGPYLIIFFGFLQFFLGIFTLLTNVNIVFASMHQINSVLLFASLLLTYYSIKKERDF